MKEYLDIINHFGLRSQMKKLNEETYEFLEAVDNFEDAVLEQEGSKEPFYTVDEMNIFRNHMVEEMGDVLLLLTQFIARYEISKSELDVFMDLKMARTKARIKEGYYDK